LCQHKREDYSGDAGYNRCHQQGIKNPLSAPAHKWLSKQAL